MSEIKLNLVDAHTILVGTIHGSVGDACVAALTAEPETMSELENALARYIKPDGHASRFSSFRAQSEIDATPHDAGLMVIDLAARVVAVESTYSQLGPEGEVYHNGEHSTEMPIRYTLHLDWLFVNSVESYRWSAQRRRTERLAKIPIDTRTILYGMPLLEFIAKFQTGLRERGFGLPPQSEESVNRVAEEIVKAHASWLTAPREDLGGRAPRDVMLEKRHFIDMDLDSRGWQWSMQGEGPPCLPVDSYAYRYAGFGTHEWVVYYDLVRYLFCMATLGDRIRRHEVRTASGSDQVTSLISDTGDSSQSCAAPALTVASVDIFEGLKSDWLESPQPNYDGRTPSVIIDNERRRLPVTMTPQQLMIDEDCECCQMLARDAALGDPTFWHLDGCNMEDEFAFSTCLTIQEWEAEQRRREEWELDYARRDAERREWDRQYLEQIMREVEGDSDGGEFGPDDWAPIQLESHEMAQLLEQMKRTHRIRSIQIGGKDQDLNSALKRDEPVN